MNQREFFETFERISGAYNWYFVRNQIFGLVKRGPYKGTQVTPVTAVARSLGKGLYIDTFRAGKAIGITSELSRAICNACLGVGVNGHSVVVKGKILRSIVLSKNAMLHAE